MHHWVDHLESRRLLATVPAGFTDAAYGAGFNIGTAMQFAPDGRLFVARQNGELRIINTSGTLLATPAIDLDVNSAGERGLLGLAFDPNFGTNGYIYLYYTVPSPIHNRVSRFTVVGNTISSASEMPLLDLPNLSATNHNGGAMNIGTDGKLYIATGENAVPSLAQSLSSPLGKILRINLDGSIPTDNPFYSAPADINDTIWARGLRNPYTFAIQPGTGTMLINDVGQSAWEEINPGIAGANYGWNDTEGDFNQATWPNFTRPIYSYDHSAGQIAITGGAFYNPSVSSFPLSYVNRYFFAEFGAGWIKYIDPASPPANNTAPSFLTGASQPVDIKIGPDGFLYYLQRGSGNGGAGVRRVSTSPLTFSQQFIVDGTSPRAHQVRFVFNRDVAGSIVAGDLTLTNMDTMTQIPAGQLGLDYTAATRTANFFYTGSATGALPEGNYRAVLPAGAVDDSNDIPTTTAGQVDFHVLPGDANNDRVVNTADFNRLAGNFGQSGAFSAGNFNYLGSIDSQDFNLFLGQYGKRLNPPTAPLPAAKPLFAEQTLDDPDLQI